MTDWKEFWNKNKSLILQVVLALLGSLIGIANWCILINNKLCIF